MAEYKLTQLQEYDEGFKQIASKVTDLDTLIGIALMESEQSPTMILIKADGSNLWKRWYTFYRGREIRI